MRGALAEFDDWSATTDRPSQYRLDVVADAAALAVLRDAAAVPRSAPVPLAGDCAVPLASDFAVLSEESGLTRLAPPVTATSASHLPPGPTLSAASHPTPAAEPPAPDLAITEPVVILDPVDGSTNASRRIPYYCTSICVLDELGFAVGLVLNLVDDTAYTSVRGGGAWRDGVRLDAAGALPSPPADLASALVASNGALPPGVPCAQSRTLGSAALDLCGVAEGRADVFVDPTRQLRVWDYAAGALICQETGASVAELADEPLAHTDPTRRLGPMAARTSTLMSHIRATFPVVAQRTATDTQEHH